MNQILRTDEVDEVLVEFLAWLLTTSPDIAEQFGSFFELKAYLDERHP